ncbi:MAG TPA: choline ABC transporter ATP-binding protein [Rhodospirillaceae bacterium]|nr:choline ABC transporter ATP-binding protein [Rhodospirillaceae bacterium]MAX60938.1 choline ABC transporter ATP-binding protein [Rhodospirillaceae bacterium]MAX65260.1 choline ABC transporter ATP-binding protein [Rhodospirillaceae bacterium]MBB55675.1 choline ABC transporter ATP-binding protein [Rhodospirillaceae bacterium]HAD99981.1 choline ABC transporter ATP-binding protein [Rhodospirillaceae bacterium]|tara:strand:- start:1430 stop:2449 length:1020 start_codon:yes stop_codon:yes gene_type:complete
MSDAVIFDNVSIVFGKQPAAALPAMDAGQTRAEIQAETGQVLGVHNCNLTVAQGEILVLMGLSGSGKSTLLRAVNGLNPVVRGSVSIDGGDGMVNITQADPATLRKMRLSCIAMVFQQFALLPWRNVVDNVALGLELAGMDRDQREAQARKQLDLVGLTDWADRKVGELSGGMQQRVGLARAFATDAPILLMDEPFSALDPLIRTRLQDELLDLQARLKRTIIFVSHDLDEAFKLGGRIAIMEGGRIVQCGTPQEIIRAPANDYVADFVAHMNPLGVLCAQDVMVQGTAPENAPEVPHDMTVNEVIKISRTTEVPIRVLQDGKPVGIITSNDILDNLAK